MTIFQVTYHHKWKLFEMGPFILIGAIGGLVGAIINRANVRMSKFRKTSFVSAVCTKLCAVSWYYSFDLICSGQEGG